MGVSINQGVLPWGPYAWGLIVSGAYHVPLIFGNSHMARTVVGDSWVADSVHLKILYLRLIGPGWVYGWHKV